MARLAVIIGGAFLSAYLIRRFAGPARVRAAGRQLDGLVVLVMLVFAIAIMDGATAAIQATPEKALVWIIAAFIANPGLQLAGALVFSPLGLRRALTLGLLSGNCNMGLLLASLPPDSDPDVQLFFALAQLPMYTLPALALPIYKRLLAMAKSRESLDIRR
jgi:BASS family bile acid:Na+ symporter